MHKGCVCVNKYIIIRLIDGTEYYVNQSRCVVGRLDAFTGKKESFEPRSSWTVKGVWHNKLFGKKAEIDLFDFLNECITGHVVFEDKKGWKYGIIQVKDGKEEYMGPLCDYGISFIKLEENNK